jgi:uncharacterized membrane protein YgdD (TMEM256/DUF423 family)
MSSRSIAALAGILGLTAVALGAFGAHGLEGMLAGAADAAERLSWWETGARYHLVHAVALLGVAWLRAQTTGRGATVAAGAFALGALVFSGTLYAMALGGPRWLGAVTPIGGLSLMAGWAAVAWSARTMRAEPARG